MSPEQARMGTQQATPPAKAQEAKPKAVKTDGDKAPKDRTSKNFDKGAVITRLSEKNPKREGSKSHVRFAAYKTGMTVEQFIAAGGTYGDLAWDSARSFISIAGHTPKLVVKKEPKAKTEPAGAKAATA